MPVIHRKRGKILILGLLTVVLLPSINTSTPMTSQTDTTLSTTLSSASTQSDTTLSTASSQSTLSTASTISDTTVSTASSQSDTTLSTASSQSTLSTASTISDTTVSTASSQSDTTLSTASSQSDTTLSTASSQSTLSTGSTVSDTTLSTASSQSTLSTASTISDTTVTTASSQSGTTLSAGLSTSSSQPGNESTVTSAAETTQSTTSPPATLPPNYEKPNFGATSFEIGFTIGFIREWDESFTSCETTDCQEFRTAIQNDLQKAFTGCPGYKAAIVDYFYSDSDPGTTNTPSQTMAAQIAQFNSGSYVFASYKTSFDTETVLSQSTNVSNYISNVVEPRLIGLTVSNYTVFNETVEKMSNTTMAAINELNENPCFVIGKDVCPLCYPCQNNPAYPVYYGVTCPPTCGDNEICTVINGTTVQTSCTCADKYLLIASDCVHENWVIGLSAGLGGALLLGLLIAVIVLCCKKDKKDKDYDHLAESQTNHNKSVPYEALSESDKHADSSDVILLDSNHHEDRKENGGITSEELVVAAAAAAAVEAAKDHGNGSVKGSDGGHVTHDARIGEIEADYDNASLSPASHGGHEHVEMRQHHHPPAAAADQIKTHSNDYYRSLYYDDPSRDDDLPKEITQSPAYAYFVPRLNNIDPSRAYHIKRPQIALQPMNGNGHKHSDYNNSFF